MHYVYVLCNNKNEWYIGYTHDLVQRCKQHRQTGRGLLVYYEAYFSEQIARNRERRLKYYGSAWRALKRRIDA